MHTFALTFFNQNRGYTIHIRETDILQAILTAKNLFQWMGGNMWDDFKVVSEKGNIYTHSKDM